MKKIAAIATAAPLAFMLTAGTALATSYAAPAEPGTPVQDQYQEGGNLACVTLLGPDASPAELQAQAQAILKEDPGDPNGLDADGDGLACEFSEGASGEVIFEDGSGFVTDFAQYQEPPVSVGETPEPEALSPPVPASAPGGTVIDEAAATRSPGLPKKASAPTTPFELGELPATGGAPVFPISGGLATAATALVGTALLLTARSRPPGV